MPSNHQKYFFQELRDYGLDVIVFYYERVSEDRLNLGWEQFIDLPHGEYYVDADLSSIHKCHDWRQRIHIVPGYGSRFTRKLTRLLCRERAAWFHWSEPSRNGLRWWLTYPIKLYHGYLVNKYARGAFANGDNAADDFARWGIKQDKIYYLPYSVPALHIADCKLGIEETVRDYDLVFLYIGSLSYGKATDVLIKAFSLLRNTGSSFCLLLVGFDKSNGEYARMAKAIDVDTNVFFLGPLQSSMIGNVIDLVDVVVQPSRYDGWGMTLNEAASMSKAIISTTAVGAARHLILNDVNGYVVAPNDSVALSIAMQKYIDTPELANVHGKKSLELFSEFTPSANVKRLIKALVKTGCTENIH